MIVNPMLAAVLVAALGSVSAVAGADPSEFDIDRYTTAGEDMFETFHVEETIRLAHAIEAGTLDRSTDLLVATTAAGKLALIKDQMAFHHIAQGSADGKDWMATF